MRYASGDDVQVQQVTEGTLTVRCPMMRAVLQPRTGLYHFSLIATNVRSEQHYLKGG